MTTLDLDRNKVVPADRANGAQGVVQRAELSTPIGMLQLYLGQKGIVKLALPRERRADAEAEVRKMLGPVSIVDDEDALGDALRQLREYFDGRRTAFSLPLDLRGTPFQLRVWEAVGRVPYGETRSYRQIAEEVGSPAAVRAVGAANGANPVPLIIPCHRVIGANGTLTGYGGGLDVKAALLAMEGVALPFSARRSKVSKAATIA